jgi:hypothetical protein
MKVRVLFCKGKPDPSEIEEVKVLQKWMIENLYDLGWEGEFKNLVTPEAIVSVFRAEASPFGIPFKKKHGRDISVGDLIQIGPTHYLVLERGFRELRFLENKTR